MEPPPDQVRAVPIPESMQPVFGTRLPAGVHTIVVEVTVTPPPAQFASVNVPATEADIVCVRKLTEASPASKKNCFTFFVLRIKRIYFSELFPE